MCCAAARCPAARSHFVPSFRLSLGSRGTRDDRDPLGAVGVEQSLSDEGKILLSDRVCRYILEGDLDPVFGIRHDRVAAHLADGEI
jgi:hypothetical protein